jgi:cation diffusion facilitator family transporter
MSVFKFVVGMAAGSKGLVADAVHSLADALSSLLILITLKIAKKPKDRERPFGHGKAEYISSLFASIVLFIGATMIFLDALHSFKTGGIHRIPHNAAIAATVLSLLFSFLMYTSNKCAGSQLESPALMADASESLADCVSSGAVLIGLVGTKLGYVYADTIAAGVVSLLVFHISVEMFFMAVNGLIDVSADSEVNDSIVNVCRNIHGVEGVREVRTRKLGQKSWVDITIDVLRKKTVMEAYDTAENVKEAIMDNISGIDDVFVKTVPVQKWGFPFQWKQGNAS